MAQRFRLQLLGLFSDYMKMRLFSAPSGALIALLSITATARAADPIRLGSVAELYMTSCASCHGDKLQGGSAPSMLDDEWTHGGDDASLARSIHDGFPEKGMPAWSPALTNEQIRSMVIFIREQRAHALRANTTFTKPQDDVTVSSELHRYRLQT